MSKYRFKKKEEFEADGLWNEDYNCPESWNEEGDMNHLMGQDVPDQFIERIEQEKEFSCNDWKFKPNQCILNSVELSEEEVTEILNQVKNNNSLITRKMKKAETKTRKANPVGDKFVFMDKTVNILNVGFSTSKNVILYGPGE